MCDDFSGGDYGGDSLSSPNNDSSVSNRDCDITNPHELSRSQVGLGVRSAYIPSLVTAADMDVSGSHHHETLGGKRPRTKSILVEDAISRAWEAERAWDEVGDVNGNIDPNYVPPREVIRDSFTNWITEHCTSWDTTSRVSSRTRRRSNSWSTSYNSLYDREPVDKWESKRTAPIKKRYSTGNRHRTPSDPWAHLKGYESLPEPSLATRFGTILGSMGLRNCLTLFVLAAYLLAIIVGAWLPVEEMYDYYSNSLFVALSSLMVIFLIVRDK